MSPTTSRIAWSVAGLAVAVGLPLGGYFVGRRASLPSPSPTAAVASPAPTETPTPTPSQPVLTSSPIIQGAATGQSASPGSARPGTQSPTFSPRPAVRSATATPTPVATPTSTPATTSLHVVFVRVPAEVRSGQSFPVEWRVEGPTGARGERTVLRSSYTVSTSSGNSQSSSQSSSQQSFGSFTVPDTFSTTLSFGGSSGTIHLTVTADVAGQTTSAEADVRLVQ